MLRAYVAYKNDLDCIAHYNNEADSDLGGNLIPIDGAVQVWGSSKRLSGHAKF